MVLKKYLRFTVSILPKRLFAQSVVAFGEWADSHFHKIHKFHRLFIIIKQDVHLIGDCVRVSSNLGKF